VALCREAGPEGHGCAGTGGVSGAARLDPLKSSELTTKQAAELLSVSRPFFIGVLESGAIPHRKIGRQRRVLMKDVLGYKKTMQVNRRAALDELVEASEDAGGYDSVTTV
jgi:excisionase family DNA binding protein